MEALSPRSVNVPSKAKNASQKDKLQSQAAAVRKAQKDKEHAPAPPELVREPDTIDGGEGRTYYTGASLGKGGFAICHEGILVDKKTGKTKHRFALKIVRSVFSQKKMEEKFRTELQIHSKMHHPNIVEFHRAFTFDNSTYLVLELCVNGSIMDMIKRRRRLTLPEIRRWTIQLCGAVKYMHHKNVIHRDLKMGNLFLDSNMDIKVGDFGLAAILITDKEASHVRRTTLCGTPNYIAPEILEKGKQGHDGKVDIWGIGVILFAMATGQPPFQSTTPEDIYRKVRHREYAWPNSDPSKYPDELRNLVGSLLVDAALRPDPDEIVSQPFFTHGFIPETLDARYRMEEPSWPNVLPPGPETVRNGYSKEWLKICQECGVGRIGNAPAFEPAGQDIRRTIYKECEVEAKLGKTPIVPVPADVIYTPLFVSKDWPEPSPNPVDPVSQNVMTEGRESMKAPAGLNKRIISGPYEHQIKETIGCANPNVEESISKARMPTATRNRRQMVQSHSAQLRQQNLPRTASTARAFRTASANSVSQPKDKSNPGSSVFVTASEHGLLGTAPLRPSHRELEGEFSKHNRNKQPMKTSSEEEPHTVDEAFARSQKARTMRKAALSKSGSVRDQLQETHATITRQTRAGTASKRSVKAKSSGINDATNADDLQASDSVQSDSRSDHRAARGDIIRPALIDPQEWAQHLEYTEPSNVLDKLEQFHRNLTEAIAQKSSRPRATRHKMNSLKERPIVIKWVDYTNKFGIGYILNDGSIGCLIKPDGRNPSTCIIVRGAESHLRKRDLPTYAERHQFVPMQGPPVEFLEDGGDAGFKRVLTEAKEFRIKVTNDGKVEKMESGSNEYDNRKRWLVVLWKKFANYMTSALGNGDLEGAENVDWGHIGSSTSKTASSNQVGPFIKFYQRFGNVGVWGFGNGSFQFNFPDHTKLILSEDGQWCDFYHLPVSAAIELQHSGVIASNTLDKRDVLSYPTQALIHGSYQGHVFSQLVEANQFEQKLAFVRDAVEDWCQVGGIGRTSRGTMPSWTGMRESSSKSKPDRLVWVTVGARGGDHRHVREDSPQA